MIWTFIVYESIEFSFPGLRECNEWIIEIQILQMRLELRQCMKEPIVLHSMQH